MTGKRRHKGISAVWQTLWLGLRKGRSGHDILMWGLLQLSMLMPLLLIAVGLLSNAGNALYILSSPVFWLITISAIVALLWRLHFLATQIGCTRQMNISEDGNPARCLVDLGHHDCCKHIGPGGDKTSCRYWKPDLIVE